MLLAAPTHFRYCCATQGCLRSPQETQPSTEAEAPTQARLLFLLYSASVASTRSRRRYKLTKRLLLVILGAYPELLRLLCPIAPAVEATPAPAAAPSVDSLNQVVRYSNEGNNGLAQVGWIDNRSPL